MIENQLLSTSQQYLPNERTISDSQSAAETWNPEIFDWLDQHIQKELKIQFPQLFSRSDIDLFVSNWTQKSHYTYDDGAQASDFQARSSIIAEATLDIEGKQHRIEVGSTRAKGAYSNQGDFSDILFELQNRVLTYSSARRGLDKASLPVLLTQQAAGIFVHEVFGHVFEANHFDLLELPLSFFNPDLCIWDNPLSAGEFGSYQIDDEGFSGRPTPLLINGVVHELLTSQLVRGKLRNASHPSNGHGRVEKLGVVVKPRMSNLYVSSGKVKFQDMLELMNEGLLVQALGGSCINWKTGEYKFIVREAQLYPQMVPVFDLVLVGNLIEAGEKMRCIGNQIYGSSSFCRSSGQSIPVSHHSPSILLHPMRLESYNEQ
jgi:TldD protein